MRKKSLNNNVTGDGLTQIITKMHNSPAHHFPYSPGVILLSLPPIQPTMAEDKPLLTYLKESTINIHGWLSGK